MIHYQQYTQYVEQMNKELQARLDKPSGYVPPIKEKTPQIKLGQLKEMLKDIPDDVLVQLEGCDCYGDAVGVDYKQDDNVVLITRKNS